MTKEVEDLILGLRAIWVIQKAGGKRKGELPDSEELLLDSGCPVRVLSGHPGARDGGHKDRTHTGGNLCQARACYLSIEVKHADYSSGGQLSPRFTLCQMGL